MWLLPRGEICRSWGQRLLHGRSGKSHNVTLGSGFLGTAADPAGQFLTGEGGSRGKPALAKTMPLACDPRRPRAPLHFTSFFYLLHSDATNEHVSRKYHGKMGIHSIVTTLGPTASNLQKLSVLVTPDYCGQGVG